MRPHLLAKFSLCWCGDSLRSIFALSCSSFESDTGSGAGACELLAAGMSSSAQPHVIAQQPHNQMPACSSACDHSACTETQQYNYCAFARAENDHQSAAPCYIWHPSKAALQDCCAATQTHEFAALHAALMPEDPQCISTESELVSSLLGA